VWFLYNVPRGDLILCNLWLSVYMDILLYALIIELVVVVSPTDPYRHQVT
jgi:hypothetical protein